MKERMIDYGKVYKGNQLFCVPYQREGKILASLENPLLWSLKEFDFKVFCYLDSDRIISEILKMKVKRNLPFYDMDIDMYKPESYPANLKFRFMSRWTYAAMMQAYRYYDGLIKQFEGFETKALAVKIGWHSNSHYALQVIALDADMQEIEYSKHKGILFSAYTKISESFIEHLMLKISGAQKQMGKYKRFVPNKAESPIIFKQPHYINKYNAFFLLREKSIYCGMKWKNPDILYEVNWDRFMGEMIHPKGCNACNPGLRMRIGMPEDNLKIFKHTLMKDFGMAGNDCYSIPTQCINLLNSQWKDLKIKYPQMEKIIFSIGYEEKKGSEDQGNYISVTYADKDWEGPTVKIYYTHDGDYKIQNGKDIILAL